MYNAFWSYWNLSPTTSLDVCPAPPHDPTPTFPSLKLSVTIILSSSSWLLLLLLSVDDVPTVWAYPIFIYCVHGSLLHAQACHTVCAGCGDYREACRNPSSLSIGGIKLRLPGSKHFHPVNHLGCPQLPFLSLFGSNCTLMQKSTDKFNTPGISMMV